ncbi:hypothetical protein, partial [Actinomyces sp. MRS3W]|uniref:hypothetical protein n=1 Tax=Actinomyces sp. MRS3W TaxID=2800796 RepID=UPI0028FD3FF1
MNTPIYWKRCARAVMAAYLVTATAACGVIHGSDEPTQATSTPLTDETICGVFANQDLRDTLGFNTYRYSYGTGPDTNVKTGMTGYRYRCNIASNSDPFGLIEIWYGIGSSLILASHGQLEFDEIIEEYPDATRTTFNGVEGEGWIWNTGVDIYVAVVV